MLFVSVLPALWTFSQTMTYLQKAFNKVYGIEKGRGGIWSRVFSFLLTLSLQILFVFALLLALFGRIILNFVYEIWHFNERFYAILINTT
ncbi:Inner membrane protein YihY, formerly thought to be RNase BN [Streptococcus sp. DD10]|nr:Inner membrane protein YihY, formerly thought to be RNase BN [Streptococcus sp. DD10]